MSLEADLTALAALPPSALAKLTNPSAPAPRPLPTSAAASRAELSSFLSSSSSPAGEAQIEAGVAASRAYVTAMRAAAAQLAPRVVTGVDREGARLEGVREQAEVVRGAVQGYAAK